MFRGFNVGLTAFGGYIELELIGAGFQVVVVLRFFN